MLGICGRHGVRKAKFYLAAAIICGTVGTAQAAEVYSFSGTASYQANGTNTGGTYDISFQGPDAPQSGGPGYTYVYNLVGKATFTPFFPSQSNPVVTGDLLGSYTLLLRQDAVAPAYYVDLLDSVPNILWSITGDPTDVGQLDLTKPGSATPTTNIIDQNFIDFAGGGYALIQFPQSYLTFTISDAAVVAPEPATWAFMLTGLGVVGAMMRRRALVHVAYG
jgi:hypothetical protein